MYANRAANAAPQNTGLWFCWDISARLAGQYQVSINAYNRGLRNQPGSIQSLWAGTNLRQDGPSNRSSRRTAKSPSSESPKRERPSIGWRNIFDHHPNAGPQFLKRAEALQPSARSELLIARAVSAIESTAGLETVPGTGFQRCPVGGPHRWDSPPPKKTGVPWPFCCWPFFFPPFF